MVRTRAGLDPRNPVAATARLDRVKKMPLSAEAGVAHLRLVDPDLRTLEVDARDGAHWLLLGGDADQDVVARAVPFDAIELELSALWAWGFVRSPPSHSKPSWKITSFGCRRAVR